MLLSFFALIVALEKFFNLAEPPSTTWRRDSYQEKRSAAWAARQKILDVPGVLEALENAKKRPCPDLEEDPAHKKQAIEAQRHTSQQEEEPSSQKQAIVDPFVGQRVAKYFDDDLYYGTVDLFIPAEEMRESVDVWHIAYDDGDAEDMDRYDLDEALELYVNSTAGDPLLAARATTQSSET